MNKTHANAHHLVTYFPIAPSKNDIPTIMPSPFSNTPHPLAKRAAIMLQDHLSSQRHAPDYISLADQGKMFGILVVRACNGEIGFLSAFSGMLNKQWQLPNFVPQIFKQAEQDRFLLVGRAKLAKLTEQLLSLETSPKRHELIKKIANMQQQRDQALASLKEQHKSAKQQRRQQRLALQQLTDPIKRDLEIAALALASQHHKREATNISIHWCQKLQLLQQQLDTFEQQIGEIKACRTKQSRQLHSQVFATYRLKNRLHEEKSISHFYGDGSPPAGSGDCAGAKLIHYAHQHQLLPIALAEFWWGRSSAVGVRHHGHYYPACRGKCLPILPFMLRGLELEAEPCYGHEIDRNEPKTIYEDVHILVINKPAELMSTPGKKIHDSVLSRLLKRYPECPDLTLLHRLDMGTSGLLLLAKNAQANKFLQKQFIQHKVEKRYEALLNRRLTPGQNSGEIDLPLRVDLDDRPRQLVCYEYGKIAKTQWQLIAYEGEITRVYFYPLTGRTHQLRVHASHAKGLHAAIVGDALYGLPAERLMLHAQRLCFTHPVTRKRMEFELPAPF
ncbi:MAG: pseudouridine synthase [Mariprofundus sp.]|nr:pseudouridine synthase [Mariprofundus sp.]